MTFSSFGNAFCRTDSACSYVMKLAAEYGNLRSIVKSQHPARQLTCAQRRCQISFPQCPDIFAPYNMKQCSVQTRCTTQRCKSPLPFTFVDGCFFEGHIRSKKTGITLQTALCLLQSRSRDSNSCFHGRLQPIASAATHWYCHIRRPCGLREAVGSTVGNVF